MPSIKKIVYTEEDGSTETVSVDEAIVSVVATLDDDTEVTLFPLATTPGDGEVEEIAVPLDTTIKLVARP